ncbi:MULTISPECIES: hypothetical protein [Bacillus cereus group]|nr:MULTISPECIES: hypothetical protein [Bacillus cereus group]MCQ6546194.1 hypothetical protein [Bacillus wiedmannii]MCQ6574209.1 hypothetical protein [Bacillus wiedmannii]MCU5576824.1 hypothetical protein [Bacillus wiedmannii]MDM5268477.1 hypothetical protein [Bacillus wiedmannii]MEE3946501.1 hypothetical protein [Bacillus wiedmannii]
MKKVTISLLGIITAVTFTFGGFVVSKDNVKPVDVIKYSEGHTGG